MTRRGRRKSTGPRDYLLDMPHRVYRHFDKGGRALYVGCSKDAQARFKQHMFDRTWWAEQVARTQMTIHPSRDAGWEVEKQEIRRLEPLHNSEIYHMDYKAWSELQFIEHGQALALDHFGKEVNPRSGLGRIHGYYQEKFGRDLFEDMGPVGLGRRNARPEINLAPRNLTIEQPFHELPPVLRAVSSAA